MRLNYNLFFAFFQGFGGSGLLDSRFFSSGSFFSSDGVFRDLGAVVDAVDEASNAYDKHIDTKEAGKHGDFKLASIENDEGHNTANAASEDANEAIGWIDGRKEAMEEVNNTGNEDICGKDDELESKVAIGEEEDDKGSNDVNGRIDDTIDPTVFFGGVVESVSRVYNTHEDKEDANRGKNDGCVIHFSGEERDAAKSESKCAAEDKCKPVLIDIFTINMCHDFSLIKMLVLIITHFCMFKTYIA